MTTDTLTLTIDDAIEIRDAMYSADHALRAVLDDTRGNDPHSLKRARNMLTQALGTLRGIQRRAHQLADEGAPKPPVVVTVEPKLVCGHTKPTMNCDACQAWYAERKEPA